MAETIRQELAKVVYSQRRGLTQANKFFLKIRLGASLRAFHAIFMPGPSRDDVNGRFGPHVYERERFPPDLFPDDWHAVFARCVVWCACVCV